MRVRHGGGGGSQREVASALLEKLDSLGARVRVDGEQLRISAPPGALSSALREEVRNSKAELIRILSASDEVVERLPRDGPLPLGIVQQRMWMMDRLEPGSTVNNLPGAWRLLGALDRRAFERALETIVDRHEILRSRIVFDGVEPRQVVEESWRFTLPVTDLTDEDDGTAHARMMASIAEERDRPFDLEEAPLFRCRLFVFDPDDHVFFLLPHHVIWDGWSWDVFLAELSALYAAFEAGRPDPLPPMAVQFADFAAWHRGRMTGRELERQVSYWTRVVGDGIPALEMPTDRPRKTDRSREGDRRTVTLDGALLARLGRIGQEEGATLFMTLLAAYVSWLHRRSGQSDFAVGVPTQDRLHEHAHRLIGVLVNTLVIRARPRPEMTFRELLSEVRDACIEAYDHQDVPLDRVLDEIDGDRRGRTHEQLFQTLFAYQDVKNRPTSLAGLDLQQVHVDTGVCPADMLFGFMIGEGRGVGLLDFDAELFDTASMDRMAESFMVMLRDLAEDPGRRLDELLLVGSGPRGRRGAGEGLFATSEPKRATGARPTAGQEAVWFLERVVPGTPANHVVGCIELEGDLEPDRFADAFAEVVSRYDALAMAIRETGGHPEVLRGESVEAPVRREAVRGEEVDAWLHDFVTTSFDLQLAPLMRVALLELGEARWAACIVAHALIADDRSIDVLLDEWVRAGGATGGRAGEPSDPVPSFTSYPEWERERMASPEARAALDWWSRELAELPVPATLPSGRSLGLDDGLETSAVTRALSADATRAWSDVAARAGVEADTVLALAVVSMLRRATGMSDVSVGVVVPVFPDASWHGSVGPLNNMAVLRSRETGDGSVTQELRRLDERWSRGRSYSWYPFSAVLEHLHTDHREGWNPVFQVSMRSAVGFRGVEPGGVRIRRRHVPFGGAIEPLTVVHGVEDGRSWVTLEYQKARYEAETAADALDRLVETLEVILGDPERPAADLLAVSESERKELLERSSGEALDVDVGSVAELLARSADEGDRWAVGDGDRTLSYGELWDRSGMVAARLRQRGIGRGSIVGACFERSVEMVVGLLGIWRAGGAYLPLDPAFPEERLAFMVEDAEADLVLTDGYATPPRTDRPEATLEEIESRGPGAPEARGEPGGREGPEHGGGLPVLSGEDLAYVLYTSGSTGRPKGVEVTHGNLVNFILSMMREPGLDRDDVLLAITTLSFDISGLEIWGPLCVGATVFIAGEDEAYDGELLADRLDEVGATVMQATPSTWRMLLDAGWEGRLGKALCGGEAFPRQLVGPLLERADQVWNMYGPTETTIWSTIARIHSERDGSVPIGAPIANTTVYVMDAEGELSPPGVSGELWIGGSGVARGYRGRPELTDERFVEDPFVEGGRAYRTGDLVRWHEAGWLEHLGRLDDQIKIHGHRIELGEIEAVLAGHEAVSHAAATAQGEPGHERLAAFFVAAGEGRVTGSELRRYLREKLPDYMIPGAIEQIEALPMTANGKIDRRALPDLTERTTRAEFEEPSTEAEIRLAEIWRRLLGIDRVSALDNFFELGGHSLLAIRAAAEFQREAGLRVDPRALFFGSLRRVAESARTP